MFKKLKNKFNNLPINKRAALIIAFSTFTISIILTFVLQIILRQSELEALDTMRTQFPNYVAAREEILDAFMSDRISRYLSFMPLFAGFNFFIMYYAISYLIGKFYGPVEEILQQINLGKKVIKLQKAKENDYKEYDKLISKYNRAITDAFEREEAFEEFMQNAAHEIKTPLFALRTSLDVLKIKEKPTLSAYKNFQNASEVITGRLNKLIESLIIISKGKKEFVSSENVSLSDILLNTVAMLRSKAGAKAIQIKIKIQPGIVFQMQSRFAEALFTNVIDNAIKYSHHAGTIQITLSRNTKDKIEFVCNDEGIGIPVSEKSKLFERFFRASNAINAGLDGSGLGLAVVKKIVDEHGGQITIDSDKGVSVIVRL